MSKNFREMFVDKSQIEGFINLPRTAFNKYIFDTAYDALTARNGIRILVVNNDKARGVYDTIFKKLGYDNLSGNKYIIGNSVIKFNDIFDVPRGVFYKYVIQEDLV
ncbi:hypothetical protein ZPAH1_orf00275 [Aeromonas phage ZPAH1]|nr:hypothetical protein ASwh1_227 [Aeromonas phage Aswh_1]QQG34037.1 hypothetical protein ZPAH1_orf00275 [Aeromonas phage ZPAH1]